MARLATLTGTLFFIAFGNANALTQQEVGQRLKDAGEHYKACMTRVPDQAILAHGTNNPTPAQLQDSSFASDAEVRELALFIPGQHSCLNSMVAEAAQLSPTYSRLVQNMAVGIDQSVNDLAAKKLTWGAFNQKVSTVKADMLAKVGASKAAILQEGLAASPSGPTTTPRVASNIAPPVNLPSPGGSGLSLFGLQVGAVIQPDAYRCVGIKSDKPKQSIFDQLLHGQDVSSMIDTGPTITPQPGHDVCIAGQDSSLADPTVYEGRPYFTQRLPQGFWDITVGIDRSNSELNWIQIRTRGVQDQELIFATLAQKFGKPTSLDTPEMQNMMGAKFNAISAIWTFPDGAELKFVSGFGNVDFGFVTAKSGRIARQEKANDDAQRRNERAL